MTHTGHGTFFCDYLSFLEKNCLTPVVFFVRNAQSAEIECDVTAIPQPALGVALGDAHARRLALQPEDKGPELVDEGIVTKLACAIFSPTERFLIRNGTGMLAPATDAINIREGCTIGHDDLDGIEAVSRGTIAELAFVVEPPTPGCATYQGTTTAVADRDCGHTGEWRAGTSQYLDRS